MANNTSKYGFRPAFGGQGGIPCPKPQRMSVASAYQGQDDASGFSVDLNIGDPVSLVSTGTVGLANGGDPVWGVIVGFGYYWDGEVMTPTNRLPGGNTWGTVEERRPWVWVVPANACQWEVDVDENTTATTFAAYQLLVGQNIDHQCVGDATTAQARPLLDMATVTVAADTTWRIEAVSQTQDNRDFSGERVKLIVSCNESQAAGQAATTIVGV